VTHGEDVDVLVVGAGPTGLTLANILGKAGVRTCVIDREPSTVQAPRAVSIDDEALRVMQGIGLADAVMDEILPDYGTRYRSPWGSQFAFVRPTTREYGFPRRSAFRQPKLAATLLQGLHRFPSVSMLFGHTLVDLDVSLGEWATASVEHGGIVSEVRARYVVGADGASSTVRRLLGIELEGTSFEQRWLVIDAEDDDDDSFDTVAFCDHRRAAISLPGPSGSRRWEILLKKDESDSAVLKPEWMAQVLGQFDTQPPRRVVRTAVYSFHARMARQWRQGPAFLVGDAAHLTPPYAGQGMNSGIRDAANLGWKLAAVIHETLHGDALDSYETERRPHAWGMVELALRIGRVMTPDTVLRAYGQAAFFHLTSVVPSIKNYLLEMRFKPKPRFETGLILPDGVADTMVGRMLPQPLVGRAAGAAVLLDEILGPGFCLVSLGGEPVACPDRLRTELSARMVRILPSNRRPLAPADWIDVRDQGGLTERLSGYAGRVLLVRPDRYVAGSFADSEAERFAADVRDLLKSAAVRSEAAA
jgi:3-(3-hydroxy-phenyl)propionate hydroxylase